MKTYITRPAGMEIGLKYVALFAAVLTLLTAFTMPAASADFKKLSLIFLDVELTPEETSQLKDRIEANFNLTVHTEKKSSELIAKALVEQRGQYDAAVIVAEDRIFSAQPETYSLAFTNKDIFVAPYNFLLSHSDMPRMRTVISTYRLSIPPSANSTPAQIKIDRLYKLLLRRIGALSGLQSDGCAMAFSNSLAELDQVPASYCDEDAATLRGLKILK